MNKYSEYWRKMGQFSERITTWIGSEASIVLHTFAFIAIGSLHYFGVPFVNMMVILNTAVSLEAIYLAIFIQMTVNRHSADIEDIQEDVQELGEGVEELGEGVADLGEGIEEISEDMQEGEEEDRRGSEPHSVTFEKLESSVQKILSDLETLKNEVRK
jgi:low affinity Fe/Cu permease